MKKQLSLFQMGDDHGNSIWPNLPNELLEDIENIFAQILAEYLLTSSNKEVKPDES